MGNLKPRLAHGNAVNQKDIQVKRPRPVRNGDGAVTAEPALDLKQCFKEPARGQFGLERDGSVEEARLLGKAHRRGGVERRTGGDAAQRMEFLDGGGEGCFRWSGGARQIGSQPDVASAHLLQLSVLVGLAPLF